RARLAGYRDSSGNRIAARKRVSVANFAKIGQVLRDNRRFSILSHVRPDGDALGSQLALGLVLKELGKSVLLWNEEGMINKYSFLPSASLLTKPPTEPEDVDVAIALD